MKKDAPQCPLCLRTMRQWTNPIDHKSFWVCTTDKVGIEVIDPLVGHWQQSDELWCPMCHTRMRLFATSKGYMKAKCQNPKCRTEITAGETLDLPQEALNANPWN